MDAVYVLGWLLVVRYVGRLMRLLSKGRLCGLGLLSCMSSVWNEWLRRHWHTPVGRPAT